MGEETSILTKVLKIATTQIGETLSPAKTQRRQGLEKQIKKSFLAAWLLVFGLRSGINFSDFGVEKSNLQELISAKDKNQ